MQLQDILMVIQLLVLLAGLGAIVKGMGRKDQTLDQVDKGLSDLHGISKDLVKSVVSLSTTSKHHDQQLADISRRLEHLERSR
jgi:hypothetical protein